MTRDANRSQAIQELITPRFKCGHAKSLGNVFAYEWSDHLYKVCKICKARRQAEWRNKGDR